MNRVLCSAALAVVLFACVREEQAPSTPSVTTASAIATAEETIAPANHDVTGAYFAMDALPDDFAEIAHLSLATIDENAAPAPLNGFLRPKSNRADDYKLVNPSLTDRRLTFETTANGGVQYAFDGQFEMLINFPENPPDSETVVLSGTLTRIRDGQTAASTPVRFRYEAGG